MLERIENVIRFLGYAYLVFWIISIFMKEVDRKKPWMGLQLAINFAYIVFFTVYAFSNQNEMHLGNIIAFAMVFAVLLANAFYLCFRIKKQ